RTPSQVAINWVRQRPYHMIPILGARSEKQLQDNLGCLDFELTEEQITCLNEASPIDLGFPHSFLSSDHVHGLIFGKTFSQIMVNH
ncbi:MAG TPA: aldo/keto reductase, partial [Anaerolineales bacterium]|nr:aldo/keto reductase [Anaerolineales bacterium]